LSSNEVEQRAYVQLWILRSTKKDPAREVGECEIQTLKQTHARDCADLSFRTRIDALQASTVRELQVLQQRQAMIEEHRKLMNALKAKYSAFEDGMIELS
jgi:hypothetical protein